MEMQETIRAAHAVLEARCATVLPCPELENALRLSIELF